MVLLLLAICWILIAGYLSFLPESPSGVFGHELSHAFVAAVLVFAVGCLVLRRRPGSFRLLIGCGIAAGMVVEIVQYLDGRGRSSEILDVLADTVGVLLGAFAARAVTRSNRTWTRSLPVSVVAVTLLAMLVWPVRESAPAQQLLSCRGRTVSPDAARRSFDQTPESRTYLRGATPATLEQGSGRMTDPDVADLVKDVRCAKRFNVSVTVATANTVQAGPRRIVSISRGTGVDQQNLMIGQSAEDLSVRIRFLRGRFQEFLVSNVFAANAEHVIVVDYDDGLLRITVDGTPRLSRTVKGATLANWNPGFPLNLGNEYTEDRLFEGDIRSVDVSAESLL